MKKISIIVCAYNESSNIESCLNSILVSLESINILDYFELIVVDNDSSDNTFELSNSFLDNASIPSLDFSVYKIQHCDLSTSRNTAVNLSNGEFVWFVDADASVSKDWASIILNEVLSNKNDLMLLSGPVFDKSVDRPSHSVFLFHFYISNYDTGKRPFIGANMGIKKSVFENIKFASELKRGDDSLFYLQCKSLVNFNHRYLENAVVHNDFPICYIDWIRNTFREGYCGGKILSCSNNNIFINIKYLAYFFPLVMFFLEFNIVLFFLILMWFLRIFSIKNYWVSYFKTFGYFIGLRKILIPLTFISIRDIGLLSSLYSSRFEIIYNGSNVVQCFKRKDV